MPLNWLVTGATGFLGRHISCLLAQDGHIVHALARDTDRLLHLREAIPNITLIPSDISDKGTLPSNLNIDFIVHCAALSPSAGAGQAELSHTNVTGTENMARLAIESKIHLFINMSSVSVYGDVRGEVTETAGHNNPDEYGISKFEAERVLRSAAGKLNSVSFRLPGVVGEGAHNIWLSDVLRKLREGSDVDIFNPNALFNNVVHVNTVYRFCMMLSEKFIGGVDEMNLASSQPLPIHGIVNQLKKGMQSSSRVIEKTTNAGSFHVNITKAVKDFDFPALTTQATLRKYINDENRMP